MQVLERKDVFREEQTILSTDVPFQMNRSMRFIRGAKLEALARRSGWTGSWEMQVRAIQTDVHLEIAAANEIEFLRAWSGPIVVESVE